MNLDKIKERLRRYRQEDIIVTKHAEIQAFVRRIDLKDVKENILNPQKLVYARKLRAEKAGEEKYDCYFAYSKHLYHRYILTINRKVIIVTIIKINRDWQKAIG